MRSLLLLPLIIGTALPVYADLGPADTSPETEEPKQTKFDAWCVKKYSDCLAKLEKNRLMVDESTGISSKQVIEWSRKDKFKRGFINLFGIHYLYIFSFQYEANNGNQQEAKIIFQSTKYADRFYERLKAWAPSKEYKCVYNFDTRKETC